MVSSALKWWRLVGVAITGLCIAACAHRPTDLAPHAASPDDAPARSVITEKARRSSIQRLDAAIRELSTARELPSVQPEVRALRALGDALEATLDNLESIRGAQRVHQRAKASESNPERAAEHARAALTVALGTLEESAPFSRANREALAYELQQARSAVLNIDPSRPLERERPEVHRALVALARALSFAAGSVPVLVLERPPPPNRPEELEMTADAYATELRGLVHRLSLKGWDQGRGVAVATLRSLANGLQALELSDEAFAHALERIRFQAIRLEISHPLEHITPTKAALLAVIDALDRVRERLDLTLSEWTAAARMAVYTIDERTPYELQRTRIQDAFRSAADTFAVAASAPACR
jgi:hypothetical protein